MRQRAGRDAGGAIGRAKLRATHLPEPLLEFAGEQLHVDQKAGLARHGPASLGLSRHPVTMHLGFVGTGESVDAARTWIEHAAAGVPGVAEKRLPDFPGFQDDRGFFCRLVVSDGLVALITTRDLEELKAIGRVAPRFEAAVKLVGERVRLLAQQDAAPNVVILALPDPLLDLTARVRFHDEDRGLVHRDFRRALKAELMQHRLPTQILLQYVTQAEPGARGVDHPSRVAWNLFTSLYFKAGGVPWRPVGLSPDTCYIGVSFHRPIGSADPIMRSSVAQAFDEHGTGLVLRGPDFPWDSSRNGPSPHLDADHARALLELVLKRYRQEAQRPPARVVLHKTSRYWEDERRGFQDALGDIDQFDFVTLSPTSEVRLVRAGRYPPLRGTLLTVDFTDYLYTTGYVPALRGYPHGHVPSPLQIAEHVGDASARRIAEEILILTKMNWNSAGFAGALPITIRFSRLVGEIMREVPADPDREPLPQFKFYI